MQGKTKSIAAFLLLPVISGCQSKYTNGIEDGLTVIGIIIALMVGAYYLILKIWDTMGKNNKKKE